MSCVLLGIAGLEDLVQLPESYEILLENMQTDHLTESKQN